MSGVFERRGREGRNRNSKKLGCFFCDFRAFRVRAPYFFVRQNTVMQKKLGLDALAGLTGLRAGPVDVAVAAVPASTGTVRVWRESKGRGGKVVTLVKGLVLSPAALDALGKELKSTCGSGGTVKDGVIEVQGDHADRVTELLLAKGYAAKRAGG